MSKKTYNPDEATLGLVFEEGTATEQNGPVTVLGLTFANNDERREYFRTELNVNELASIAGYTPDYFRILFKEKTGKTPKKYILDKKIDYAKKLLEHSTLSITNISYECGFNYVPQFLVFFKKYAGLTPNQYRNESEAKQKREFP